MTTEATPRPWVREPYAKRGAWIAGPDGDWAALACGATDATAVANAELLVRAVNSFDALMDALEPFAALADSHGPDGWVDQHRIDNGAIRRARRALALAQETK